ncbi:MAG: DUF308 domain-containing protein [Acidobacteria bacterium]|nr:DUF308 domain-containing protein [Acidobacteriota bacterium]
MSLLSQLSRSWWLFLIRGLVAILFGALALLRPGLTMEALLIYIGAWFLVDGVVKIFGAFSSSTPKDDKWLLGLTGLLGVLLGFLTFTSPLATGLAILMFIAAWAIVTGGFEIYTALKLRHEIEGEWVLVLIGLISILLGVYCVYAPLVSGIGITMALGVFALVIGIVNIVFAFKLKGLAARVQGALSGRRV